MCKCKECTSYSLSWLIISSQSPLMVALRVFCHTQLHTCSLVQNLSCLSWDIWCTSLVLANQWTWAKYTEWKHGAQIQTVEAARQGYSRCQMKYGGTYTRYWRKCDTGNVKKEERKARHPANFVLNILNYKIFFSNSTLPVGGAKVFREAHYFYSQQ